MIIIGINAFHADSAAAILRDGKLIAAVEEERFRRIKHWAGFPSLSIKYCLREAGVRLEEVDAIAVNSDSRANFWRKAGYAIKNRPNPFVVISRLKNRKARMNIRENLTEAFPGAQFNGQVHNVEHHMAHLSSAFHVSPFPEASVLSVDGFGDFSSVAWGTGNNTKIDVKDRVFFPHSLGIFYSAITQYLGFPHYGDEYKIMGLAPYGKPTMMGKMHEIVSLKDDGSFELNLSCFLHHKEGVAYTWDDGIPTVGKLYSPALEDLLGPVRDRNEPLRQHHHDLAHSVQKMYEEALFNLLDVMQKSSQSKNLAIAGGCGMNSVANGKIRRQSAFENIYVQSAAGDAGGAIGAAFSVWHDEHPQRDFVMDHAYLGPSYGDDVVGDLVERNSDAISKAECTVKILEDDQELAALVAAEIAEGKVIGWFQGRLEWGPRALGNRSIICDPRRGDMKQVLNAKIKKRESFRPFAPSVLAEHVDEWFEEDGDVPFMMQVYQIEKEKRPLIPAVTHVDGSGRLQTVHKETNPLYHRLIEEFRKITGVPMVLNTSFNENEPVVCRPEEALDCFLRTNMDVLVMGNRVIRRPG